MQPDRGPQLFRGSAGFSRLGPSSGRHGWAGRAPHPTLTVVTYDDAEWHTDSVIDLGLDESAGAIHIAAFMGWACRRGLVPADDHADAIADATSETDRPTGFVATHFVSQININNLTRRGNLFAEQCYDAYLRALPRTELMARYDNGYRVPDTWDTVEEIGALLDELYAEWESQGGRLAER